MEVGLAQATLCSKRTQLPPEKRAQPPPNICPMSIVAKRLDGSRCHLARSNKGKPRPRPRCIRWGRSSPPPPKRGTALSFWFMSILWPNGWRDENATWYRSRPRPRPHCVRQGHSRPPFSADDNCGYSRPSQLLLSSCVTSDTHPGPFLCQM